MKILFTHGYFLSSDIKEQKVMKPYPPLGILGLSSYLKQAGFDNFVYDTTFSCKQDLRNYLTSYCPDVLAIYTNLMTKLNVLELIKFVKENLDSIIVLGGPDVTNNYSDYILNGADFIVIGEGEQTMLELVQHLQTTNDNEPNEIAGLVFKSKSGSVVKTLERSKIKDIDTLPFPARDLIDINKYNTIWKQNHGLSSISISSQRGCPFSCNWCSTAVYGQSYRRRSPKIIADEISYLKEQYNPDTLWFVDDVFTINKKWVEEFSKEVNSRKIVTPYECITRADCLDENTLNVLKESGAYRVWIGSESGSQKIIDAMDRRVNVKYVRDMIKLAKLKGLETGTFIMLGYPTETEEDILETILHLKDANPDFFTVTVAYPIKGTKFYEEIKDLISIQLPWENSTDRDIDFRRTFSRKYYNYATSFVTNEVNSFKNLNEQKYLSALICKLKSKINRGLMSFSK